MTEGSSARPARTARLRCRGSWLEYASAARTAARCPAAITAGGREAPIALVGLGLASVTGFFAATIVIGNHAASEMTGRSARSG